MSPPVSPCQWRDRGSGSSEPKGLTVSRKAAFLRGWKSGDVDSFRTPPPAAPPLSALSRGRGEHCHAAQPHTQASQRICQFHSQRYLAYFRKFYLTMPDLAILQTRLQNLKWSHILATLRVEDETARRWYLEAASAQTWNVRTLNRNISTQYYERHYVQPSLPSECTPVPQKEEILKTPMMAEFLGFKPDDSFSERDLESSIITHLRDFMMELGRGFAFVARQQHIRTDAEDYFIDLVFYNVVLKCYVLVDLKVGKITHQDVGQMDMYVRMYDELKRTEGDNPTIGIVLCSETDKDIARYSILKGNEQLFATKYKLYLPTEEQLRKEIERQKELYQIQHEEKN